MKRDITHVVVGVVLGLVVSSGLATAATKAVGKPPIRSQAGNEALPQVVALKSGRMFVVGSALLTKPEVEEVKAFLAARK